MYKRQELGNNALDGMHAVISDLMTFREQLAKRYNNDFFSVAFPTLNLGCIHGGDSPNRICGKTELHFDLRMTPGSSNSGVRGEIEGRLEGLAETLGLNVGLNSLIDSIEPFEQAADSELVQLAESLTGCQAESVAFATEAPFLQALGMETVVMGPGSIDRAHQPDEYLELEQIKPCIALLEQCIRHYCL